VLFVCPVTGPVLWQLLLTLGSIGLLVFVLFRWPEPMNLDLRRLRPVAPGPTLI
jgi:hypothetical protein